MPFIKCKIFVIDAVTESVNMQQDNHYDVNISYLIPMSRFYKKSVVLQSITYKVLLTVSWQFKQALRLELFGRVPIWNFGQR